MRLRKGLIHPCTSVRRYFTSCHATGGAHGLHDVSLSLRKCPANNNKGCTFGHGFLGLNQPSCWCCIPAVVWLCNRFPSVVGPPPPAPQACSTVSFLPPPEPQLPRRRGGTGGGTGTGNDRGLIPQATSQEAANCSHSRYPRKVCPSSVG